MFNNQHNMDRTFLLVTLLYGLALCSGYYNVTSNSTALTKAKKQGEIPAGFQQIFVFTMPFQ